MRALLLALLLSFPIGLLLWMASRPPDARALLTLPARDTSAGGVGDAASAQAGASAARPPNPLQTAPQGFALDGEAQRYDQKDLFEYIDGAAPQFIKLGFVDLWAVDLVGKNGAEASLELYDMGSSDAAQAILTQNRPAQANRITLGDEAYRTRRALVLRKGRYYIKLTAFDAGAEAALPALARELIERMP